jgi:hypothetical protein
MKMPIMMLCLVAACATEAGPTSPFVPGLGSDGGRATPGRGGEAPRACRIDKLFTATSSYGPPEAPIHQTARFGFDAAGRYALEVDLDADRDEELGRYVHEYDAMGNWTHQRYTSGYDGLVMDTWMAYDALGRRVREERDYAGEVDMVATFGYGDQERKTSAHVIWQSSPRESYDGTYQYDAHQRLTQVDLDFRFDGSIEQTERYTYDDDARTAAMDRVAADRTVLEHTDFTYDDDGHVVLKVERSGTDDNGWIATFIKEYDAGALIRSTRRDLQLLPNSQTSETVEDDRLRYDCD